MKIGTLEHPDICPKCGKKVIESPKYLEEKEFSSKVYSVFTIKCLDNACGYETEPYKILWESTINKKPIDVTPKKENFLKRLLKFKK
jgi:hypothetical protein